jgi:hypothetical protein
VNFSDLEKTPENHQHQTERRTPPREKTRLSCCLPVGVSAMELIVRQKKRQLVLHRYFLRGLGLIYWIDYK